jgi:hypothetical protein
MKIEYIELILQVITGFLSLYFYLKYKGRFLFFITILLLLSALTEVTGAYMMKVIKVPAFYIYYGFSLLQFTIITLMYFNLIKGKNKGAIFMFTILTFIPFWFFVLFNSSIFPYLIMFIALSVSVYVFLYLRELLLSDRILNYKELLPFWISIGFLVYYLPCIPFFTLYKYMQDRGLFFILHILIILMNLFIIYGLLCSRKEQKYL